MPIHVALLRAINVGGRNLVAMSDLVGMLAALEFTGGKSLLQSGNLIFQNRRPTGAALERLLETETEKRFRVAVDYLVRTAAEWDSIVAHTPFDKEAVADTSHLLVMCLKKAPDAKDVKALQDAIKGTEVVRADGKQLYLVYPEGIGRSKLANTLIERKLGTRGTA